MKHGNWDKTSDKNIKNYTSMAKKSVKKYISPSSRRRNASRLAQYKAKKAAENGKPPTEGGYTNKDSDKGEETPHLDATRREVGALKSPLHKNKNQLFRVMPRTSPKDPQKGPKRTCCSWIGPHHLPQVQERLMLPMISMLILLQIMLNAWVQNKRLNQT